MRRRSAAALIAVALGPAYRASAQESEANADRAAAANEVEFTVPQSPAFDFLGTSPTKVASPGTLRDLGLELANVIGSDGSVAQGFALELRPTPLIPGLQPGPEDARRTSFKYLLTRLHLSAGTVKATIPGAAVADDASATDLALGLRWTIVDRGDPWTDTAYRSSVAQALLACAPSTPSPEMNVASPGEAAGTPAATATPPAPAADATACMGNAVDSLRTTYEEEHWNAFRVEVAGAAGWRLPASKLDDDAFASGLATWAAMSGGRELWKNIAWNVAARYDHRRADADDDAVDQLSLGLRAYLGADRLHLFVEYLHELRSDDPALDSSDADWSFGVEARVTSSTWIAIGLGNALDDDEDLQMLANIRWAVSDKEHFARPE